MCIKYLCVVDIDFVLFCIEGFGCSQETDMQFDFTNDCIKIEIQFEVNVTYVQVCLVRAVWQPF